MVEYLIFRVLDPLLGLALVAVPVLILWRAPREKRKRLAIAGFLICLHSVLALQVIKIVINAQYAKKAPLSIPDDVQPKETT